jgi:hypothetical protein
MKIAGARKSLIFRAQARYFRSSYRATGIGFGFVAITATGPVGGTRKGGSGSARHYWPKTEPPKQKPHSWGWIRRQVARLEKRMDREWQALAAEIVKRVEAERRTAEALAEVQA